MYNRVMKKHFLPGISHPTQKGILILLLFFVLAGINVEFSHLSTYSGNYSHYLMAIGASSLIIAYIIPMSAFLRYLMKNWQFSPALLWTSLVCGLFVPGWMAAYGNDWLLQVYKIFIPAKDFLADWGDALTAPVVEEGLKAATALLIIAFFPKKSARQAFFIALLVGFGFQIMEDISYIAGASFNSLNAAIPQAIDRLYMSMTSHWAYTSIFVMGCYQLLYENHQHKGKAIFWLVAAPVLHFVWDSPLNPNLFTYAFYGLLTAIIWFDLFLSLKNQGLDR